MTRFSKPETRPSRKLHRLDLRAYGQPNRVCSVTLAVKDRLPVFTQGELAVAAVRILKDLATHRAVPVYAYCVMPDHVHLVLSASADCDITTFVGSFKSLVLRQAWHQGVVGTFWQRSFWDHFVRDDDDLTQVIAYVLANPVRAGIVENPADYPYAGVLAKVGAEPVGDATTAAPG